MTAFRLYLEAIYGHERTDTMFRRLYFIIVQSLKSVQQIIINDKHSFECYGYDIMIDEVYSVSPPALHCMTCVPIGSETLAFGGQCIPVTHHNDRGGSCVEDAFDW